MAPRARWRVFATQGQRAAVLAGVALLLLLLPRSAHATVVGFVSVVYDYQVSGCVYDTDDPTATLDVAVYAYGPGNVDANGVSTNGVNAAAGFDCNPYFLANQGGGNAAFNGHGFSAQLLRPIDYLFTGSGGTPNNTSGTNNIVVYAENAAQASPGQWTVISEPTGTAQATTGGPGALPWYTNRLHRATNGVYYSNANYAAGINTAFGAYLVEYYNKVFDPSASTSLIYTDPGAGFQFAIFAQTNASGLPVDPAFTGPDCLDGLSNTLLNGYNPTQAGSACALAGSPPTGSEVVSCTSSGSNALCGQQTITDAADPGNDPQWVDWYIHVRNWTYLEGASYPYTSYDDVFAHVMYTFFWDYLQVDYTIDKTSSTLYGTNFQQLPVAFFTGLTSFTTGSASMSLAPPASALADPIGPKSGRWIMGQALPVAGQVLASPGNYLTLGFYSAAVGGSCPSHSFNGNFYPTSGAPSVQQASAVQNNLTFEATMGQPIQSRALIFPRRAGYVLPNLGGVTVKAAIDEALLPSWDCSIGDAGVTMSDAGTADAADAAASTQDATVGGGDGASGVHDSGGTGDTATSSQDAAIQDSGIQGAGDATLGGGDATTSSQDAGTQNTGDATLGAGDATISTQDAGDATTGIQDAGDATISGPDADDATLGAGDGEIAMDASGGPTDSAPQADGHVADSSVGRGDTGETAPAAVEPGSGSHTAQGCSCRIGGPAELDFGGGLGTVAVLAFGVLRRRRSSAGGVQEEGIPATVPTSPGTA